ncbi:MAG: NAD-dependent epimerase/dehydratase family protein [Anaerolineales bacterium]
MKIFVTGGTGFIGSRLVRRLVETGHDVHVLARSESSARQARELGAKAAHGNVTDRESLREGLADSDVVFHIAAWYAHGNLDVERMERINVEGTRNVLGLAHELGVPKIVYTSTVAVLGDTEGAVVDESFRQGGPFVSQYDRTKWLAHYEVALPLIEQGAPIVIVMPGAVYGPGDSSMVGELMHAFYKGLMPVLPGPETALTFVHVDDVVEGHLLAMEEGEVGESYILGEQVATLREAFDLWAEITGRPRLLCGIPGPLLHPFAPLMKALGEIVTIPTLLNHEAIKILGVTYAARGDKARQELGWEPRPLREGMEETLAQLGATTPRVPAKRRRLQVGLGLGLLGLGLLLWWLVGRRKERS